MLVLLYVLLCVCLAIVDFDMDIAFVLSYLVILLCGCIDGCGFCLFLIDVAVLMVSDLFYIGLLS